MTVPAGLLTLHAVQLALEVDQVVEDVVQLLLLVPGRQALRLEERRRPTMADGRRHLATQRLEAWRRTDGVQSVIGRSQRRGTLSHALFVTQCKAAPAGLFLHSRARHVHCV